MIWKQLTDLGETRNLQSRCVDAHFLDLSEVDFSVLYCRTLEESLDIYSIIRIKSSSVHITNVLLSESETST